MSSPRPPSPVPQSRIPISNGKRLIPLTRSPFDLTSKAQGKQPNTWASGSKRKSVAEKRHREPFWQELKKAGVELVATTSKFDQLYDLPFTSTMLDMQTVHQGLSREETRYHAWVGINKALERVKDNDNPPEGPLANNSCLYYQVELGTTLADTFPEGRHFTFVDEIDTKEHIFSNIQLVTARLARNGVPKDKIIVSVPATREGIMATLRIKRRCPGNNVNLTHVSGFNHALLCIEAGAKVLTFNGTELLEAYNSLNDIRMDQVRPNDHPCIKDIQMVMHYVRKHNIPVQIMATHMPGIPSIEPLKGLDYLSLKACDVEDMMMSGKMIDVETSSPHLLQAEKVPYPRTTFDKRTTDVFTRLTQEEQRLADTTIKETKRIDASHRSALLSWFLRESSKQLRNERMRFGDIVEGHESHNILQGIIREAKMSGSLGGLGQMVRNYRERSGELGLRIKSIDWGSRVESEADAEAAETEELASTDSDVDSTTVEPDTDWQEDMEPVTSRDVGDASEIEASHSDEPAVVVRVSEERE
ncbi:hypothetical protein QCA50_013422 [Cerrena zonata]|uniref:Transaldolase n=1 Tax=Cerrena zonata TaxID=2478898 RepID=A0AAW0FWW6_9APHY